MPVLSSLNFLNIFFHFEIIFHLHVSQLFFYKSEPYTKVYSSPDWVKSALNLLGGKGNIGIFNYSTVGVNILSGIISNAVGEPFCDFAANNLFKPLNIKLPDNIFINNKEEYFSFLKDKNVSGWLTDPKSINTAGCGLTLTLKDMIKLGNLYMNNGFFNGKQIISSTWIEESIKVKSYINNLKYGYLWWIGDDFYAAIGDSGNIIFINSKMRVVIAITSSFKPRAKDRIELIKKHIIPFIN